MRTAVAETSIAAYHVHRAGPKLGEQQRQIVAYLAKHAHRDHTRNEIAEGSGLCLQSVCGRVAELLGLYLVEEGERRPDRHTGIAAHPLKLKALQSELFAA